MQDRKDQNGVYSVSLKSSFGARPNESKDLITPKNKGYPGREVGNIVGANYLIIGDKCFGVEPGFEAIELDDAALLALREIPESEFVSFPELKAIRSIENPTILIQQIQQGQISGRKIAEYMGNFFQQINHLQQGKISDKTLADYITAHQKKISVWMFKQDYEDPVKNKVQIPPERYEVLSRDRQSKSPPKLIPKYAREDANMRAIKECIANDIANLFGFPAQVERLTVGTYRDGQLKFMPACKLAAGYHDIGDEFLLAGQDVVTRKQTGLFENYLVPKSSQYRTVIKDPTTESKIDLNLGTKTTPLKNLGMLLAMEVFMEERDFVGAYGQNLGVVDGKPFKIDLGKAFENPGSILATLEDNGRFTQPWHRSPDIIRRHKLHRNVSIFYDTPYEEMMVGFHLLKKMVTGKDPDPAIIKSYENYHLGTMLANIPTTANKDEPKTSGPLTQVFKEHLAYLDQLKEQFPDKKKEIKLYIESIKNMQHQAENNAAFILKKFEKRLQLTGPQVALLSNLEKLTSNPYDLTRDKKARLTHLQIENFSRVPWQLTKNPDGSYLLSCEAKDKNSSLEAVQRLQEFLGNKMGKLAFDKQGNFQTVKLSAEELNQLISHMDENAIKKFLIPLSETDSALAVFKNYIADQAKDFKQEALRTVYDSFNQFYAHQLLSPSPTLVQLGLPIQEPIDKLKNDAQNAIQQLTYSLGLLLASKKENQMPLKLLKQDNTELAIQRIEMLIAENIRVITPNIPEAQVRIFIDHAKGLLKMLNWQMENNNFDIANTKSQIEQLISSVVKQPEEKLIDTKSSDNDSKKLENAISWIRYRANELYQNYASLRGVHAKDVAKLKAEIDAFEQEENVQLRFSGMLNVLKHWWQRGIMNKTSPCGDWNAGLIKLLNDEPKSHDFYRQIGMILEDMQLQFPEKNILNSERNWKIERPHYIKPFPEISGVLLKLNGMIDRLSEENEIRPDLIQPDSNQRGSVIKISDLKNAQSSPAETKQSNDVDASVARAPIKVLNQPKGDLLQYKKLKELQKVIDQSPLANSQKFLELAFAIKKIWIQGVKAHGKGLTFSQQSEDFIHKMNANPKQFGFYRNIGLLLSEVIKVEGMPKILNIQLKTPILPLIQSALEHTATTKRLSPLRP